VAGPPSCVAEKQGALGVGTQQPSLSGFRSGVVELGVSHVVNQQNAA
jgi:hypothetical protein